jgi:hypothetical protein
MEAPEMSRVAAPMIDRDANCRASGARNASSLGHFVRATDGLYGQLDEAF